MKKAISLIVALVMLFAVCVPAFAADQTITKDTPGSNGKTNVTTKTTDKEGKDPSTYTVSYPAEVTIAWDDTDSYELGYKVTTQLALGAQLKVKAEANNEGKMTSNLTEKTLTFALQNGAESTFGPDCNEQAPTTQPSVSIANWADAPIAAYTGTVTFTVTYEAA